MKTKLMILAALVLGTIAPAQAGFKIIPGEEYLKEVLPLLASARSSIDLLQFNFFSENGHVRDLAQRLVKIKAAHPEIRIRVALESEKDLGAPKGAATRNNLTKQLLQKSGIEVYPVYGLRDGDIHGVSHTKAIAIDRQTVLAGSTNWTNTSLDKNNEMNLLVNSGELGEAFTRYFDSVISDPSKMHPLTVQSGAVTLLTDTTYFETVRSLIERSSEGDSLDIGMYFFAYRTDADTQAKTLFDELVAAHQRGVKIRLLLERNGDPKVSPDVTRSNLRVAGLLKEAGIDEVYFDRPDQISHTKMVIYNRSVVLLGSTNWYRGDLNENHQVNWLIQDEAEASRIADYFAAKIADEGSRAE